MDNYFEMKYNIAVFGAVLFLIIVFIIIIVWISQIFLAIVQRRNDKKWEELDKQEQDSNEKR